MFSSIDARHVLMYPMIEIHAPQGLWKQMVLLALCVAMYRFHSALVITLAGCCCTVQQQELRVD